VIHLLRNELPVLRTKAKVSQEEIANRIGVSRQTFSLLETGKREMSWTVFLALIAFFQNNDNTREMLKNIEGLSDGLETLLSSDLKKNDVNLL
jgi:DNA-binding XRE family transcriptional regulator